MTSVRKTVLCGTALSALAFALPAHAQVTIGGLEVEVDDNVSEDGNAGGQLVVFGSIYTSQGISVGNGFINSGGGVISSGGGVVFTVGGAVQTCYENVRTRPLAAKRYILGGTYGRILDLSFWE